MSHVQPQQQREKQQEQQQQQQQQQEQQTNNAGTSMRGGYHDIFTQNASNSGSDSEQPPFRKRESFPETSKLVGLIRDVGSSIKDRTLGRKQSHDASITDGAAPGSATTSHSSSSNGTTPVINVVEAPPTTRERSSSYRRKRTSSIKGKSHQTEEELGTPVNIYLEHRVHLEQDKRARTDLDTRVLGETLYVPQSPTSPDLPLSALSTPSKPTHADGIDSWWAYNNLLGSCGSAVVGVQHPTSGFAGGDWRRVVL